MDTKVRFSFCVDTGASTSVGGIDEIKKICSVLKKKLSLRPSPKTFLFAGATYKAISFNDISLATPISVPNIFNKLKVVSADVPVLLGLDVVDSHWLTADMILNKLIKKTGSDTFE